MADADNWQAGLLVTMDPKTICDITRLTIAPNDEVSIGNHSQQLRTNLTIGTIAGPRVQDVGQLRRVCQQR